MPGVRGPGLKACRYGVLGVRGPDLKAFTTRPPAVTDVFVSGRIEEPYARYVVYISGD